MDRLGTLDLGEDLFLVELLDIREQRLLSVDERLRFFHGLAAAAASVARLWGDRLSSRVAVPRDPKTALQEWAQARGMAVPTYAAISREGPDHAPVFTVEVRLANGATAQAAANTKRAAEQVAARALLARLEGQDD